jgi:hypothetical protein
MGFQSTDMTSIEVLRSIADSGPACKSEGSVATEIGPGGDENATSVGTAMSPQASEHRRLQIQMRAWVIT